MEHATPLARSATFPPFFSLRQHPLLLVSRMFQVEMADIDLPVACAVVDEGQPAALHRTD
jgi:hypothetical protein